MNMVQRKFYLPEDLYSRLSLSAKISGKSITEVLREFMSEGLEKFEKRKKSDSGKMLLELAKMGKKLKWKGASDLSINHDKYFVRAWEKSKSR